MIRNAPPVIASAARFLPQPRWRSKSTSGRNVAASTMARTTGTTTSGTWMTTAITNPMSAAPTSSRQLHCATRSSQPGRGPFESRVGLLRLDDRDERPCHGRDEGHDRDGHEQPDDPGDRRTGRQRDEHDRRVDVDGRAVHDRPDQVVEDHVRDRDEDEQDDRGLGSHRGVRDQQHDDRRHETTDVGDEPTEEHEHRERRGQRDTEEEHEDEVAGGVQGGERPPSRGGSRRPAAGRRRHCS